MFAMIKEENTKTRYNIYLSLSDFRYPLNIKNAIFSSLKKRALHYDQNVSYEQQHIIRTDIDVHP